MENKNKLKKLTNDFEECREILIALGDETRQHLIIEMLKIGNCNGVRVGEITERSHLSRPAISHHLKILKSTGILKVRNEGTKNYYYFDPETESFKKLISMLQLAKEISQDLPDRSSNCK